MATTPVRFELNTLSVPSRALAGNPLGDPATRDLPILVPAVLDRDTPLPVLFLLAGYTGTGAMLLADDRWQEGLRQRLERLAAAGKIGPMIVALPDCFTRYGGSQYRNSLATGRYEDYLWQDLLPSLKQRFPVGRVGVAGKSSGGYGALVQAMRHPELISAVASHSGDLYFDYGYLLSFPKVVRALRKHGGVAGFLAHFDAAPKKYADDLIETMEILAMAACYSPDASSPHGFALPFDLETGEVDPSVWARWLALDPVRMLDDPKHVEALRAMRLVHVECGTRDEYYLDLGARIFTARLRTLGIAHHHEEFDDSHMSINYRYDVSLPLLYAALV
ncbi:MAG: esterase [Myxococcales bacterium]|nr:esterase [Myxococcales bacterium]